MTPDHTTENAWRCVAEMLKDMSECPMPATTDEATMISAALAFIYKHSDSLFQEASGLSEKKWEAKKCAEFERLCKIYAANFKKARAAQ